MISFLLFGTFLVAIKSESLSTTLCDARNATSQAVIDYCRLAGGSLQSRCCYSANSKNIVAIDLTELDLSRVPALDEYMDLKNVSLVDLRVNQHLKPSAKDDFLGLRTLNSLFLPLQFPCPGGKYVWQVINQTTEPSGLACMIQIDRCANAKDVCIEPNSYCSADGPNHFLCLCKTDYYGYKCLRHGQFPYVAFFGTSVALTLVLSVFLYATQRRHVKRD